MADRLRVSEIDFDTIKNNLKNFLRNQSEFTDYDFDGSSLSVLLDLLAYNTHYNAYYLNMVANEAFLDSALLRESVVSHAKTLGYIPHSKKAPVASINFTVNTTSNTASELTVPAGYNFLSNQIDGKSYNYVVLNDVTVSKSNTAFYFENLEIAEGQYVTYRFNYNQTINPNQLFEIPDENVDIDTIKVAVSPSTSNTQTVAYELASDLTDADNTSELYFIQENRFGRFEVYFGDGVLGKKLPDGAVVTINYLVTNGDKSNGVDLFVAAVPLSGYTNFLIDTVSPASGGSDRENVDRIKYAAPLQYLSQNRLVTNKDYEVAIKSNYPNIDSVSIWGGEDEVPPVYGKVFLSLKPKNGFFISETEKQRIIDTIITPKAVMTIKTEIRDFDYLYLLNSFIVEYDPKRTTLNKDAFRNLIRNAVVLYKNTYLDQFSSKFALSKLQESINDLDPNAIIGCEGVVRAQKRFEPVLGLIRNYTINFNIPLIQGSQTNKLTSSEFVVKDVTGTNRTVTLEEVPKSFTGVNSIEILDAGTGYTSTPTVTITGDGFGATAVAVVDRGRIQRIDVTNTGIDYNRAVVTITGGGGFGASALALIDTKVGKLRTVYYNSIAERQVVNSNAGEINYVDGIITLNDLNVISTPTTDGLIRVNCGTESSIIQSQRNTIVTIDDTDPNAILINLTAV
jgi:hypothetical protein